MLYEDEQRPFAEPDAELDSIAHAVIGAALAVHRHFGPGLDEAIYENALCIEMRIRKIEFIKQPIIPILYHGEAVGERRLDLIVGRRLVVELKAVESLAPLHFAQLKTYLKITRLTLGLLINFNEIYLKDGIKRVICHH